MQLGDANHQPENYVDIVERPQIFLNGDILPAQFRTQSYEIARDAVRYISRGDDYTAQPPSKSSSIMRDLVKDTITARAAKMNELVHTLNVQTREQLSLIKNIANGMFDDEQVSWGRIVTLHAFCGCLAKYCESRHIPDCADDVGNILADFMVHRLGLWIVTHGGWKSFERQFPGAVFLPVAAGGLWKGLIIIGLLIGAVVAFYTSVRFISGGSI